MKISTKIIIEYGILLYVVWAIVQILVTSLSNMEVFIIKEVICKNLIWLLPAIYLIKRYNQDMFIKSKEMFSFKCNWISIIGILAVLLIFQVGLIYITAGNIKINESFSIIDIFDAGLIAGITEEFVFRGCFLNRMLKEKSKLGMILINALLFLAIHFSGWIIEGIFIVNIVSGGFITIIMLSIVFSWTFIKYKSIWPSVVLHMMWNIFCCILGY